MKVKYPYEFDPGKRKIAKVYSKGRLINFVLGEIITIAILAFLLFSGGNVFLRELSFQTAYLYANVAIYAFFLVLILTVAEFPLAFYSGYVFEHKYRLSSHTLKSWLKDFSKATFLLFLIFIFLVTGLYFIIGNFQFWWILAGVGYFFYLLLFSHIFPILIFPFFYKTMPYKDERMKKRLLEMAKKAGVKNIKRVLVAKESEKSKKANAFFGGIGSTKTIVLFDTLVNSFAKREVETVVGHELGHYVNRDQLRLIFFDFVKTFPVLLLIDLVLKNSSGSFGINSISDIAGLPLFLLAYSLIDLVISPVENGYSRKREALADLFALNYIRNPEAQISTEKRLADMNLGDENPNKVLEFFLYTHPNVSKRIRLAEEWKRRNK